MAQQQKVANILVDNALNEQDELSIKERLKLARSIHLYFENENPVRVMTYYL